MALAAKDPMKFELPSELNAAKPAERRGIRRDHVRLMVLDRNSGNNQHDQFYKLENYLNEGDLLVLNTSRTLPSSFSVEIRRASRLMAPEAEIRLAQRKSNSVWKVLVVGQTVKQGDELIFSGSLRARVCSCSTKSPLVTVSFSKRGIALYDELYKLGEPIRYEYIHDNWPLEYYQTVYGTVPGSVEMTSAGRAFSWELLSRLKKKGIQIAPITLHTGLSYFLNDQWKVGPADSLEEYEVPGVTADLIRKTIAGGGRVIAVGTTVVRALESAVDGSGNPVPQKGWTNLHVHSDFQLNVVDGLITGFHEPEASHLDMLSAFVSPHILKNAYQEAVHRQYLWHEFGDMNLVLGGSADETPSLGH
ncbi:S-adenosylmethionine:tRNA ribosyltransferase-isomerase [Alkalihalobacillus sp. AL-G]|uniref:S-adenosylmethionine:tRNA ribosyltransferase-isomerase n=1 Tax=Alkalihalobacillus sp. AL-G TaxID=2926399 RepID=UPI00272AA9DB|nr:S-adenosylmethionine:tRNA ribosyltransferase-isomerase [Alkalihalobacillus sp. AL-G]WLD92536.1 S-adenosylmethionine:tRNA ribosyltransferase-isomerase [Alkalihalobacillus sp. AL-G]